MKRPIPVDTTVGDRGRLAHEETPPRQHATWADREPVGSAGRLPRRPRLCFLAGRSSTGAGSAVARLTNRDANLSVRHGNARSAGTSTTRWILLATGLLVGLTRSGLRVLQKRYV